MKTGILLQNPDDKIEGTVKELAEKSGCGTLLFTATSPAFALAASIAVCVPAAYAAKTAHAGEVTASSWLSYENIPYEQAQRSVCIG